MSGTAGTLPPVSGAAGKAAPEAQQHGALAIYGVLGLPLAAAALPVHVYLPRMYGGELGVELATLGAILLLARLADAFLDPWLGVLIDRLGNRRRWIGAGMLLMTLGMVLLFHPPGSRELLPLWLVVPIPLAVP